MEPNNRHMVAKKMEVDRPVMSAEVTGHHLVSANVTGPGTITSTIQHVERPRLLAWAGKTFGIKANHIWRLEPRDGKTIVRTEESWEGLVASIFRARMQKILQSAIDSGLRRLKAEAERRSIH